MKYPYLRIALVLLLALSLLWGCTSPADVMDDQADQFLDAYSNYNPAIATAPSSVLDTLDLMLDQYVSGLQKPSAGSIPQNTITTDPNQLFQNTTDKCVTQDEMKALLLQAMTDTADQVSFIASPSYYSNDLLYDVIFDELGDTYMIETMGVTQYYVTTMTNPDNTISVHVDFTYFEDKYTLEEVVNIKNETLAKAKEIVRDLDLANLSVYARVEAVNRYLMEHCVYPDTKPYSIESYTVYGALIQQSAVCEGYARATQLLFSLCDVDSYYVPGDTPQGGHAWNLVQVDGAWYQLDVTWNDTDSQPNMYFLVTDDYMSLSRTWERQNYPATATTPYTPN